MTQTGGFTFLIAWAIFAVLCGTLAYLILRRPRHPDQPDHRGDQHRGGESGS
jgi:hypothetical protein